MPSRAGILFINHSLGTGGIETMIVDLIRLLPADKFAPEVAVFQSGGSLEEVLLSRDVPIHHLHKKAGVDFELVARLRRLVKDRNISVLHSHNFSAWLYSALAARSIGGICHVHTEHSGVEASRRRYFAARWLSRITDHVVAVSRHVQDVMIRDIGISPSCTRLIHNGVNTCRFAPDTAVRAKARETLGLSDDDFVIGIVARLAPIKNHSLLLRAFALLQVDLPMRKRLLIVGEGAERSRLEALARQLGIDGLTHFLGDQRKTEALFNAMDVYALSSISEGMNLTLLEAMSSGLPVVATAVGGNVEIVEQEISGFLVPLNEAAEMGHRLHQLAMDRTLREKFGNAGRANTVSRFNEKTMIDQYLTLYGGQ
ncbi:MAG: glycosyltransferase [Usitatibacteraceae bacterium]